MSGITNYNFTEAMTQLMQGEAMKLPEWKGYWFLSPETSEIFCMRPDGSVDNRPDFSENAHRDDWVSVTSEDLKNPKSL